MGKEIEALAQFVAETQWQDVPQDVQRHAKLVVLDTLGVMLAGANRPEVRELRARLLATAGTGATVLAPGWAAADLRMAALLNGIAGRAIELCEGQRLVSTQPAIQILPGGLAVGEQARSTGCEMLTAFLTGYDVAARLCAGFTARPLAHQNGQATLLAAAAAGASARPGRRRRQPGDAHRDGAGADTELYQCRCGRDGAERGRRHEQLRGGAGAQPRTGGF